MKFLIKPVLISILALAGSVAFAQEEIKIGVIAPMTGAASAWGMAASEGAKILAEKYNSEGGLEINGKKHPVKVYAYDDKYQAAQSVAAFNRLVKSDGVKYIVVLSSAGTVAVRDMAKEEKVLVLSGAYAEEPMDKNNPYLWRIYSTPANYIPSMIRWLRDNIPADARNVAVMNPNDETGWGVTEVDEREFKKNGFNIVNKTLFERSTNDFQAIITKMLRDKPDIIELGVTPPSSAALFVRQAREMGYQGLFFMSGGSGPDQVIKSAGNEATEGLITMMFGDPENEGYQKLAHAYEERNKHKPNMIIVPYYDGPNVLLHAIQKAGGSENVDKVLEALPTVFPVKSLQGNDLTLGGKANIGVAQQIDTVNYIAVVKNGIPVIQGKTSNN
ncbi:ABC transporter substrate-binding protein [Pusillimonas sp. ANT_WB101]|uniref:ABC transporter substrate-binding protein n=1 Tax=Pusillimonas sp. ANT_WB101 TaxID=2597356 RepID=UPI0011EC26EB|nr:ABC transporter substrate-binding protein [Pusillimonas sp. ANT_WB101]KAA0892642.1 ABC transporter substrate-binding protein [Pusillimonas sp. ANT_WB101]